MKNSKNAKRFFLLTKVLSQNSTEPKADWRLAVKLGLWNARGCCKLRTIAERLEER